MMSKEAIGADNNGLSAAYVLHTRKYRDTSLIAELYTRDHGRVAVIARGARSKKALKTANWQPFTPLLVSFVGRGELKTVTAAEFSSNGFRLSGDNLIMAMYVNELLVRLLAKHDPIEALFGAYQNVLKDLMVADEALTALRKFEIFLLRALGYGIDFQTSTLGVGIEPDQFYEFRAGHGFSPCSYSRQQASTDTIAEPEGPHAKIKFKGEHLLAIAANDFSRAETGSSAKLILRTAINAMLGGKPLMSRQLFAQTATRTT